MDTVNHIDPFQQGHDDYLRGKSRKACPYDDADQKRSAWENGWNQALYCDKDEDVHDLRSHGLHLREAGEHLISSLRKLKILKLARRLG